MLLLRTSFQMFFRINKSITQKGVDSDLSQLKNIFSNIINKYSYQKALKEFNLFKQWIS
jgi:hypothetical protein